MTASALAVQRDPLHGGRGARYPFDTRCHSQDPMLPPELGHGEPWFRSGASGLLRGPSSTCWASFAACVTLCLCQRHGRRAGKQGSGRTLSPGQGLGPVLCCLPPSWSVTGRQVRRCEALNCRGQTPWTSRWPPPANVLFAHSGLSNSTGDLFCCSLIHNNFYYSPLFQRELES